MKQDQRQRLLRIAEGVAKDPFRQQDGLGPIWRLCTSAIRVLPDFVVFGAQRCGTTSLYSYLVQHPDIYPALCKEVNYFNNNYRKPRFWYRYYFPTIVHKLFVTKVKKKKFLTGEASIDYMYHPYAAKRLAETISDVKLIIVLRNPVDRAYSSYRHSVRLGVEDLSFEEALDNEGLRLEEEEKKIELDEDFFCVSRWFFSYLARGRYSEQMERVMLHFPRERICILRSEDFFRDPRVIVNQVLEFLGLSDFKPDVSIKYQSHSYEDMDPAVRKSLSVYYELHNRKLYELIGRDFGWEEDT